ncbi:MAG: ABC transporter permease [Lachnospiraceae bacterium]|nr:ABC transporter permease [Lachnospiraceae bacterium]
MNRILRKRFPRQIKADFFRLGSLFLIIALCMYIVIALVDAAETVISGTEKNQTATCLEDGQFTVFNALTDEQIKSITDGGVTVEAHTSYDLTLGDGSVIRVFKNRELIDRAVLDTGREAASDNEIVLEKRYCEEHDISIGDTLRIGGEDITVTGIGSSVDYDAVLRDLSDTAVDSKIFGTGFASPKGYEHLKDIGKAGTEELTYAFLLNGAMSSDDLKQTIRDLTPDFPYNLTAFLLKEDNLRIGGAAGDIEINKTVGMVAGIVVIILFTYVLSVFVIHQIQEESSTIGALYALGVKKKDLMRHYIFMPTVISFLGGAVGAAFGLSGIGSSWQMSDSYNYYSIPAFDKVIPPYLIVYAVVMPPVVSVIVNFLVINRSLSRTALSLIRNEQKISRAKDIRLPDMPFMRKFKIRQMLRERRIALTVVIGMVVSLLIFMLGLDCYVLCKSVGERASEDTRYKYMYTYKYPSDEVPEGGEACFATNLKKESLGYTLDVTVMGIDGDNPYIPVKTVKGKNKAVISDAVAGKYGLKKGDKLILTDKAEDMDYAFTVEDIVPYCVGLTVFMDIDSARDLFGKADGYYNTVMADKELDVEEERVYAVTTKEDVDKASGIFVDLMAPLFTLLMIMSTVVFCLVIFLMTSVMIDKASFGISLMKIFGFNRKEIKKLYLDGNKAVIMVGALISIPVAKLITDRMFPMFVANVACGLPLAFKWYYYPVIWAAIMVFYSFVSLLLTGRLNRMTPAEVLKNRE